jgi:Adenylate and Guanylate cyclase catalytic domain
MVDAAKKHSAGWHVRVGIHQGPVVAGVMGKRSFVFDLWGDTVNLTARVAAEAQPDAVLVTSATWPLLSRACQGRALGLVDLKGKVGLSSCTASAARLLKAAITQIAELRASSLRRACLRPQTDENALLATAGIFGSRQAQTPDLHSPDSRQSANGGLLQTQRSVCG